MAASSMFSKSYAVSSQELCNILASPQFAYELKFSQDIAMQVPGGMMYTFKSGVSFTSWGEKISITVYSLGPAVTKVDIMSECAMPTQIVDWGKNQTNINSITMFLDRTFVPVMNSNFGQPQGQPYGQTQGQPQGEARFCTSCGARIPADSAFCPSCGAKQ